MTEKDKIIEILKKYQDTLYYKGSCGELGNDTLAIDSDYFEKIADDILDVNSNIDVFEKAVEPAIRYLLKHQFPHAKIYIDYSTAELLIGEKSHNLNNEVPD